MIHKTIKRTIARAAQFIAVAIAVAVAALSVFCAPGPVDPTTHDDHRHECPTETLPERQQPRRKPVVPKKARRDNEHDETEDTDHSDQAESTSGHNDAQDYREEQSQ